tara:strand:- start:22 stop:390 length:369 start_codon:yes stop_codon:yes gene_type:complete
MAISISIAPYVTSVDVSQEATRVVEVSATIPTLSVSSGGSASSIAVTPYNTISSTNLQDALEELADQSFRSNSAPTTNVEEGDTWYDTLNDIFYVYRTLNGTLDWHPLLATADEGRLDGGAF